VARACAAPDNAGEKPRAASVSAASASAPATAAAAAAVAVAAAAAAAAAAAVAVAGAVAGGGRQRNEVAARRDAWERLRVVWVARPARRDAGATPKGLAAVNTRAPVASRLEN